MCVNATTRKWAKDPKFTEFVPPPFGCAYKSVERPPPWCAGATESEQKVFLEALPEPMRATAFDEARKANRQEGAVQKTDAPKLVKVDRKKNDKQGSLF